MGPFTAVSTVGCNRVFSCLSFQLDLEVVEGGTDSETTMLPAASTGSHPE